MTAAVVVVRGLSQISRTSRRYQSAVARNPEAASLKPMLDTVGALAKESFARGVSLDEVAEAAGLTRYLDRVVGA